MLGLPLLFTAIFLYLALSIGAYGWCIILAILCFFHGNLLAAIIFGFLAHSIGKKRSY